MNICILGSGLQGRIVAQDLAQNNHKVTVLDINRENLRKVTKLSNIKTKLFDVTNKSKLIQYIKDFDIVVGALPAELGFYSMQCAIEAGIDIADLSYSGEDPFRLDKQAKKNKVRAIPDAGFAPGLSNVLVGEAYRDFGKIDNLRILVGGIPRHPIPPFNYHYTWSPNDLVAEYTRPARIVNNYKTIIVEALSGIEKFSIPKIGKLECFYTDGLRTLIKTFKHVKNMEEKTIRYAGHAELIKELLNYGFTPDEDNPFTNSKIQPKEFILDFLKVAFNNVGQGFSLANKQTRSVDGAERYQPKGLPYETTKNEDLTILLIDIKAKGKNRRYTCIDYYDKRHKITSMARMTAYSGSIITQCIKDYPEYGVIAPEYLGVNEKLCNYIKSELKKRGIRIKVENYFQ